MDCKKEIFADGIGQVHFAGGMVRFDFVTLQPAEEGKAPIPESNVRIIMPPPGFPWCLQQHAAADRPIGRSWRSAEE